MSPTLDRYLDGSYVDANPDWHVGDSAWKAEQIHAALGGWRPQTICEVGCGAGEILRVLHDKVSESTIVGYDVSPTAIALAAARSTQRLTFKVGHASDDEEHYDLMLVIDVIEHVPDPVDFLRQLAGKATRFLLHIPLDISVASAIRGRELLEKRAVLGHIHSFSPETALATVTDAGYHVISYRYTPIWQTWPMSLRRSIARYLPQATAVRLVGGYSLLVTADAP